MLDPVSRRMTVDQYLAWREQQVNEQRYELVDGYPVAMAPQRARHVRVKGEVFVALRTALRAGNLPCETMVDGMQVKVDESTVFEPDVLVYCGDRASDDAIMIDMPIIVVEVLSPSTQHVDTGLKFRGYFGLASVRHYLVVFTDKPSVAHHRREDDGRIISREITARDIALDPPGITVPVQSFYG